MPSGLIPRIFSVREVTDRIRDVLARDEVFSDLWVAGEVSNFRRSGAGHAYFTLKEEGAALECVAWRSNVDRWPYTPRDGEAVLIHGYISFYQDAGRLQLYVDLVEPAGLGRLYVEFQALKERLEREGLFAPERKRPLPPFPQVVGVVTSPHAAAFQDILRTLKARFPPVEVVLAPARVQGEEAPGEIVAALQALGQRPEVDVIILARGGGSLEDLWAFNDEAVARAVAASPHPVVAGIGHETDFTIADFAADWRVATPTAAAAAVVPDRGDLLAALAERRRRLDQGVMARLREARRALEMRQEALAFRSPAHQLARQRQRVDELERLLGLRMGHHLDLLRRELATLATRLRGADPTALLARGYALVFRREDGQLVRSVRQVTAGQALTVRVSDGQFGVSVSPDEGT